ncbi:hypothetical protein MMC28_005846 [Mycoblastus sanguinarius]|nr:hypothetical protein [Mycoblastus sanguinarius]
MKPTVPGVQIVSVPEWNGNATAREAIEGMQAQGQNGLHHLQLLGIRSMFLEPGPGNTQPGFGPNIPDCFTTLEEARNSLDYIWNGFTHIADGIDSSAMRNLEVAPEVAIMYLETCNNNRKRYKDIFQQWQSAFQSFLFKSTATMNTKALRGATTLKISWRLASMHLDFDGETILYNSQCWDHHITEYSEMVTLATAIIGEQKATDSVTPS